MLTSCSQTWEGRLLALAYPAGELGAAHHTAVERSARTCSGQPAAHAYAYCDEVTAQHSKTFYAATRLLPLEKRQAVRALYAFCRVADDIVDGGGGNPEAELARYRQRTLSTHPAPDDPLALAWTDTRLRYGIPTRYAEQLIEGVARDCRPTRYETFEELAAYAYGVACTVGLMSMHIIGFSGLEALPYAIKLGVALQVTNILRDVGQDWRAGRLYLPCQELAAFGLSDADVARGRVNPAWREFMRFQIARNRQLYAEALPGVKMLNRDGRLAVQAAGELYRAILEDIEAHDYDVFTRRAHVSTLGKLRRLPGIWVRSRW